jgi:PAS domain S-box-containing protein
MDQRDDWHLTEAIGHKLGRGDPFAAAIRGTRMPMVITDPRQPDNPIVFANQAFQSMTGYSRDEIIGRNCRLLQGPDSGAEAIKALGDAIRQGEDIQVDILNYRKDGSTFWNALFLSPVRAEDGQIQFFFGSQFDVTDRIRAKEIMEREVQRRTAELEAALDAKTLLLHEVDHRVKNNLTMIGSLLRLQVRSLADPVLSKTLESMLERIDALATATGAFTSRMTSRALTSAPWRRRWRAMWWARREERTSRSAPRSNRSRFPRRMLRRSA